MTYKETCEYLYSQLPMFEQQGASGYKEGLENSVKLDEHFGFPHRNYRTIHIAGTNGKGSCAHTISAILQMCGYKVGLYTSPHLVDFSERIRINGNPIPEDYVIDFVQNEKSFFEPLKPTFFELVTAMAFKYFADKAVDIAVIETGMGGRLDCTNIITPILSVITNIGLDHTQFLGSTLEQIAMEKAGIIKPKTPVVIGETTEDTRQIFDVMAAEVSAPVTYAEDSPEVIDCATTADGLLYHTVHDGILEGELAGIYQKKNANTILCAIRRLEESGLMYPFNTMPEEPCKNREIREGFKHVCDLTGLKGRWQKVKDHPLTICDTGHNVPGWTYLSEQLKTIRCKHRHIVFGMVDDKDIDKVLDLLPKHAKFYFTKAQTKRAIQETVVQAKAKEHGLAGSAYPTVNEAYNAAFHAASANDFIFVGGSSYVVGDFLKDCI